MTVTAANQLYTLAGVAQLVESFLIEQVTFNHRVERSNRFTSTMYLYCSGNKAVFQTAIASSNLTRYFICILMNDVIWVYKTDIQSR